MNLTSTAWVFRVEKSRNNYTLQKNVSTTFLLIESIRRLFNYTVKSSNSTAATNVFILYLKKKKKGQNIDSKVNVFRI